MVKHNTSPQIDWRVEFETGDAAVDHEHKDMIGRINGFLVIANADPETDSVLENLGEIFTWISAHFALEEKIMRDHRYAHYNAHKEDHEALLDDLRDIMEEIELRGYAGAAPAIQQRLSTWFLNHFKSQDSKLHSVVVGKP